MSYFLIFGFRDPKLSPKRLNANTTCPNCQRKSSFEVYGEASYFHLFWIPVIPLGKSLRVRCVHCGHDITKENFPKDVKEAIKLSPIRRPFWHYIVPAIIVYKLVSMLFVLGYMAYEDAQDDERNEKEKMKLEQYRQQFVDYKNSMRVNASFEADSISYMLQKEFPFDTYNINASDISLFSKIKGSKLILLMNVQKKDKVEEAAGCNLVNDVKHFITDAYPDKYFTFYVVLFENKELKMVHTPQTLYDTEYASSLPLYGYFNDDMTIDTSDFKNRAQKRQLLTEAKKGNKEQQVLDVEVVKEEIENVAKKFRFSYRNRKASAEKSALYECKFVLLSGNKIPEEIRAMLELHDGNGPLFNWNFLFSKSRKMKRLYRQAPFQKLLRKEELGDQRILPLHKSPYWIPFYEDSTFSYALDMLPGKDGHVGQVILLRGNSKPKYIAKNMLEFLELYKKKKLHIDLKEWSFKKKGTAK